MSAAKRDPRRNEFNKYLDAYRKIGAPEGDVFEQALWCVLARNGSRDQATRALATLRDYYVDMNELRVAKVAEVAGLIKPHVRNDPERVAALARGFLRAVVRDQHQMSFDFTDEMSIPELRKFLVDLGGPTRDVALAMAIHFCRKELDEQEAPGPEDEEQEGGKPRAKGGHDLRRALDRLRLAFTVAGYGHSDGKGQPGTLVRRTLALLDYAELPPAPEPEPEPKPAVPGSDDHVAGADSEDEHIDDEDFDDDDESTTRGRRGTTRRRTARKQTARKKTVRKTTARKPAAGKSGAKKTPTRAKAAGKKTGTGKSGAGKSGAGKTGARKSGTGKTGARKSGARKTGTGKTGRKKTPGKKTGGKKVAKKKPAARKTASKSGKTATKRGGGTARPKSARKTPRRSSGARKSSRRR